MRRGGEGARWLEDALHLLIKNLLLIPLPLSHSSSPCLQTSFIHVHPLFNLICLFSLVRTLSLFGSNLTFCDGGHVLVPFSHCWFNSQSVEAGLSGTSRLWRKKAEKKPIPVKCVEKVACQGSLLRSVAFHQRQNQFSTVTNLGVTNCS